MVEVTFATADPLPLDEQITPRTLPAVKTMACVMHQGAPDTIGQACVALLSWSEANGYQVAGPERVRSTARSGRDAQDNIVDVRLPVVRAPARIRLAMQPSNRKDEGQGTGGRTMTRDVPWERSR